MDKQFFIEFKEAFRLAKSEDRPFLHIKIPSHLNPITIHSLIKALFPYYQMVLKVEKGVTKLIISLCGAKYGIFPLDISAGKKLLRELNTPKKT